MTPLVVWLVGWFQWWFGIPAAALLALGLWQALSGPWRVTPRFAIVVVLLVAAGWVMISAAGGVFDVHNYDWIKHRLVFLELGRGDWPIILSNYLEVPAHLRYYLGYYMVPGVISKLLGVAALNWAVPVWTWCGASLVLVLFTRDYRGWKVVAAAMILILFSGMDFVRTILLDGPQWLELRVGFDAWPWIGLGRTSLESGGHYGLPLMYASPTAALLWTPQHFIAAALYALLPVSTPPPWTFSSSEWGIGSRKPVLVAFGRNWPAAVRSGALIGEWNPTIPALAECIHGAATCVVASSLPV